MQPHCLTIHTSNCRPMHTTAQHTKPRAPLDARNPELSSRRRTHSSSHAPAVQSHKTIVLHFSNLFLQFSNTLKIGRGILEFYESLFEPYVPEPVRYKTVCSYNFPLYPRYGLYLNACTRGPGLVRNEERLGSFRTSQIKCSLGCTIILLNLWRRLHAESFLRKGVSSRDSRFFVKSFVATASMLCVALFDAWKRDEKRHFSSSLAEKILSSIPVLSLLD